MQTPIELEDGYVVRGHHRVCAARTLGLEAVPVVFSSRLERWTWDPTSGRHVPYTYDDFAYQVMVEAPDGWVPYRTAHGTVFLSDDEAAAVRCLAWIRAADSDPGLLGVWDRNADEVRLAA